MDLPWIALLDLRCCRGLGKASVRQLGSLCANMVFFVLAKPRPSICRDPQRRGPQRHGDVGLFGGRISRISTLIRHLPRSFGPQKLREVLGWLPPNRVCTGQSHGHKNLPGAHVHRIHHIDFECGFDSSARSKPCSPETRQPKRRSPRQAALGGHIKKNALDSERSGKSPTDSFDEYGQQKLQT